MGTNNLAELLALKLLLTLALEHESHSLYIFGDFQLVINWVLGKFRIKNMQLTQVLHEVIRIYDLFERVDYKHIYCERNSKADALAKEGVNVLKGHWHIHEFRASETYESFQVF